MAVRLATEAIRSVALGVIAFGMIGIFFRPTVLGVVYAPECVDGGG
ncbi:hypothetical protein [Kaistia adipata]|nr:hypothetical protein [Kaistia adipata]